MNRIRVNASRLAAAALLLMMFCVALPAEAQFSFVRAKNGIYGGAEVGFLTSEFNREKIFEDVIFGTDVDFDNILAAINAYVDNSGLTVAPGGLVVNRITVDKNNTFASAAPISGFNNYFGRIASKDPRFAFSGVDSLQAFYNDIGDPAHQVGLIDVTDDRAFMLRFFGGYNFKAFFGVEVAGWLTTDIPVRNRPIRFSYEEPPAVPDGDTFLLSSEIFYNSTSNFYGLEAVGKLRLPLHPFFAYAKAGVAFVYGVTEASLEVTGLTRATSAESGSEDTDVVMYDESIVHSSRQIRPVVGAGIAFRAGESAVINLAYHHYERAGEQEPLDVVLLSFTFEVTGELCGDLYC